MNCDVTAGDNGKAAGLTLQVLLASAVFLLAACSGDRSAGFADTVFVNANVYTSNPAQPRAEAVAIAGNEIVYVGDNAGAERYVGGSTERRDLDGRLLLPGFIDTHMHPVAGGGYATALSLDTFGSVDSWVAAIAAFAEENADAPVLFGYGFLATTFGPVGPTRQLIDAVVPDRPVLIMDEGFHAAWANTAALDALNITQDTPDPVPGYSYYKRDENGDATGYLLEGTAGMAMNALDVINEDVITEGTAIVIDTMNRYGVTAAFDAGAMGDLETTRNVLRRVEAAGEMTVRIVGSSRPETAEEADGAFAMAEAHRQQVKGERYHYNTLKIPNDGTVEGRTAAMFEDYQGEPGNSGTTVFSEHQVAMMMIEAASADMDVHVHALGERAVHETLNAIETAREARPDSQTRYTICHLQVVTDQDLVRFAELDVIAQSTPLWASYDTYGEQFVSADQFSRYWRFGSLAELGVRLTFGSDFPASGAGALGISPVIQIEIGHTRQDPGDPDSPVQPRESERLSIEALVKGYTIDAAYQLHMEEQIGSLEVGKKADLVVLDQNIFDVDPYTIHRTEVDLTMMDGDVVYERPAS